MNESNTGDALTAPSAQYLLGTDNLGRDLFSRIIFGARVSLIIGLGATALSTVFSISIGIITAYFGGIVDLLVQRNRRRPGWLSQAWLS